ncbi:HAMP domain-containing histidine kinase [Chryseobacterium suipulveris]|uniref:histidine kinase n=1 Tax=Chryseobacterium suipulveris TaxID=2929800 RepID=A0ABY4BS45_9FLAO|nr:HAMP domain-containing sensor histidine kinase [Chryseobacterium suipulveris]UOE41594.1 HAMP domain-containing histidine kinase [Chryseobacterium suipulveris]
MNIKNKIALNLSLLFSVFLGLLLIIIYLFFAEFRKDEFVDILKDRISTVANYFDEDGDKGVDVSKIYNTPTYSIQQEEILVFNEKFDLIYSSLKDQTVNWDRADLEAMKIDGVVYHSDKNSEVYGEKIKKNYFLIESADILGKEKLSYLGTLMFVSFLVASALVWVLSFLFARKMMAPLDIFQEKITRISASNLTDRLPETDKKDEINLLAKVFNTMLGRIDKSYSSQKEFTASASHEIKTPLTRMAFQLENLSELVKENPETKKYIRGISDEVYQLSDTVNSLLLLSKLEEEHLNEEFADVRMDEVVFDAFENVRKNFPDFELNFNISEENDSGDLTVKGIKPLLDIVFINLFKNACLYSHKHEVEVEIGENETMLTAKIKSHGDLISEEDSQRIFNAFKRGETSSQKSGSGLGLRICKRILDFHHAKISYQAEAPNSNIFIIEFPLT